MGKGEDFPSLIVLHIQVAKIPHFFDVASKLGRIVWVLPFDVGLIRPALQAKEELAESAARGRETPQC